MNSPLIECVPNIAEGRNQEVIQSLVAELRRTEPPPLAMPDGNLPAVTILHLTSDADHNRTVITFAGSPQAVLDAAVRLAIKSAQLIDVRTSHGVHPRLGSLDVLPFVPLAAASLDDCVAIAHQAGQRIWREAGIPVYFYEAAALRPDRRKLEDVRRGEFEGIQQALQNDPDNQPDVGGPSLHPSAGAVIVGARKFLIAYNINLRSADISVARRIARSIRASNGGLPAVKALGLSLASRGLVQVSMNLTDFEITPISRVFAEVSRHCEHHGIEIEESELIGLVPSCALDARTAEFIKLREFGPHRIIENQLAKSSFADPEIISIP